MTTNEPISTNALLIDTTDTAAGQFVGVHVLRPVVAVNLNANMDGTPKTLGYGDATRLRVSSQARKRAMREWTHKFIDREEQAVRTRKVPGAAAEALTAIRDVDYNTALNTIAVLILGVGKFSIAAATADRTEELAFVPRPTPALLAQIADTHWDELSDAANAIADERGAAAAEEDGKSTKGRGRGKKQDKKKLTSHPLPLAIKKQIEAAFAAGASSEIALNGRMLTALPDTGAIDAAASVAHSYSVDPVRWTYDEWTAKDDWQDGDFDNDKTGAAMLDTRTLASGCLYEWAALDRNQLRINLQASSNLEGDALTRAVNEAEQLFVSSAAWAVPSASSHTTGSVAPPVLVVATVSDTPPLTPPIFEEAITENVTPTAATYLADYLTRTARRRHPINGGIALWMPARDLPAPTFPPSITVEES